MAYQHTFHVANPSPYVRSDYVEVNAAAFDLPADLDERSLRLFQVDGDRRIETPCQVDEIREGGVLERTLTFFCRGAPAGADDYTTPGPTFVLEQTARHDT